MKQLLSCLLLISTLVIMGCNLFTKDDDDNDPVLYEGGVVDSVRFQVMAPTSIQITWAETFTDEDGFYIDRKVWDGEWHNRILHVGPNVHSVIDETGDLDEVYYYHVYAYKGDAESVKEQIQYNFNLPYPDNVDWSYNPNSSPTHIRLFWTNLATWADSIVVAKKINYEVVDSHYAKLAGNATEYTDVAYDHALTTTYGFTAYYQDHTSQQYNLTLVPPK